MAPTDLSTGIAEYGFFFDQGLRRTETIYAQEPEVTPHDLTVDLPDNMDVLYPHAYGTVEEFVKYLRTVNNIPKEAQEELMVELETRRKRVRFKWWTINGWTLAQENVFTHGM